MGPIRSKIGKKGTKLGLFGVLSFMKIPLVVPILDQKEQNFFGHPQFCSSIAPMLLITNLGPSGGSEGPRTPLDPFLVALM